MIDEVQVDGLNESLLRRFTLRRIYFKMLIS